MCVPEEASLPFVTLPKADEISEPLFSIKNLLIDTFAGGVQLLVLKKVEVQSLNMSFLKTLFGKFPVSKLRQSKKHGNCFCHCPRHFGND